MFAVLDPEAFKSCFVSWVKSLQSALQEVIAIDGKTLYNSADCNLFLHYVFDKWMQKNHQGAPWCRYADDGLVHCRTEAQAQQILCELTVRF